MSNDSKAKSDGKDYTDKLRDLVADVIKAPGGIASGPPQPLPPYTPKFKEQVLAKDFTLATDPQFLALTGMTFKSMIQDWVQGGIMTSCNSFVATCGFAMGAKDNLGKFEMGENLRKLGKGHAWVLANTDRRPNYGDLFRAVDLHMGVSLGFEGDQWHSVEGGQGGRSSGRDLVLHKVGKFNPGAIMGWCDMRVYLDPRPGVPEWLAGTWLITCGDKEYVYEFTRYYEVFHYPWKPVGGHQHVDALDTGDLVLQGGDHFAVNWHTEGGTEKFEYQRFDSVPEILERATGTSSRGEPLKCVRL